MISGLNSSNNQSNSVSVNNSPVRGHNSFEEDSPMSHHEISNNLGIIESSEEDEEEKDGEVFKQDGRKESFASDDDSVEDDDEEWNISSQINQERETIPIDIRN